MGRSERFTALLVIALAAAACGGGDGSASTTTASATVTTTTTTTSAPLVVDDPLPAIVPMDAAQALPITAAPSPDWVSIAGGSAWVANVGDGIGRYDATSG